MAEFIQESIDVLKKTGSAVQYSLINLGLHPLRWLVFDVLMLIPLVNYIILGMLLKIEWHQEFAFKDLFRTWFNGFRAMLIIMLYELIPILLILGCLIEDIYHEVNDKAGNSFVDTVNATIPEVTGINAFGIFSFILPTIFIIFVIPAEICFARKGFLAAFNLDDILVLITETGWIKFIGAFIFQIIIIAVLRAAFFFWETLSPASAIPAILVFMLIVFPLYIVCEGKFWSLFFEDSSEEEKENKAAGSEK